MVISLAIGLPIAIFESSFVVSKALVAELEDTDETTSYEDDVSSTGIEEYDFSNSSIVAE